MQKAKIIFNRQISKWKSAIKELLCVFAEAEFSSLFDLLMWAWLFCMLNLRRTLKKNIKGHLCRYTFALNENIGYCFSFVIFDPASSKENRNFLCCVEGRTGSRSSEFLF